VKELMIPRRYGQVALLLGVIVSWSCSKPVPQADASSKAEVVEEKRDSGSPPSDCTEAARQVLGPQSEILKYGDLNSPGVPEAIAVVKLGRSASAVAGTAVSQAVILRWEASTWKPVLKVGRQVTNDAGYIGIDYIDDSYDFHGYRLIVENRRPDGKPGVAIELSYLNGSGETEGIPMAVSWNEKTGRYQEYTSNEDPPGFRPEIRNPPHKSGRTP
jgi:hypothetical protein